MTVMPVPDHKIILPAALASALLAGAGASAQALLEMSGERETEERLWRESEAKYWAGLLHSAAMRTGNWLEQQRDGQLAEQLIAHLQASGQLPAADAAHSPFTAGERQRYVGAGIEMRICGEFLAAYIRPGADGYVGRVTAGEVRSYGQLDIITASGFEVWGEGAAAHAAVAACGLPDKAPARFLHWRAPATERRKQVAGELRDFDCPAGQVGTGIVEARRITSWEDGFGADLPAERQIEPWSEQSRDCRAPRSGAVIHPVECRLAAGPRAGGRAVQLLQFPWREGRDPDDPRRIVTRVDWAAQTVIADYCNGAPAEAVEASTSVTTNRRQTACQAFHGEQWDQGGPVDESQTVRAAEVTFPDSWNRAPNRVENLGPWKVMRDDCRRQAARSDEYSKKVVGSCPPGQTGGRIEYWRRDWIEVVFADPVPAHENYELEGSSSSTFLNAVMRCYKESSNKGKNWVDRVTGIRYDKKPIGANFLDGYEVEERCCSTNKSQSWEQDRKDHKTDGDN